MSRRLTIFLLVAFASSWLMGLVHFVAARAGAHVARVHAPGARGEVRRRPLA